MDIVIEIFLEMYMELMFLIIPERNASKRYIRIAKILAVTVVLGIFALVIWGCVLIVDHGNLWGIAPIAVAVLFSLAQIIAGILLFQKHH